MRANLRQQMPQTAALVDQLRLQHGADQINSQIRKSIGGQYGFWARENGIEIGCRDTRASSSYVLNERGVSVRTDPDWMQEALEFAKEKGIVIDRKDYGDPDEARIVAARLREILKEKEHA